MSVQDDDEFEYDQAEWAKVGASKIYAMRNDSAISTADYAACGFAIAAAELILTDPEFQHLCAKIGALMEPPRYAKHLVREDN